MIFSKQILLWYAENKRNLPWRNTLNPYNIWLSEIILQQTRVAQGTPYYLKFVNFFPTVQDLAAASEEEVLKLWQGLGYYSRARNLHATAKIVSNEYNGVFPNTYKGLLKLKGVGDYTASAIASISFNLPEPVVDGNVYRVLARYFGVAIPINSTEGIKYFKDLARKVMSVDDIRDYNQGIMEFGAIQCAPKNPKCSICPLKDSCVSFKDNRTAELPVKLKKIKVKIRYFNYLVIINKKGETYLQKRIGKGIWQNLYEFPLIEADNDINEAIISHKLNDLFSKNIKADIAKHNTENVVHKLSHQHLHTTFWIVRVDEEISSGISVTDVDKYPVPVLIADFIKTFNF